jgi:hypothetical protein
LTANACAFGSRESTVYILALKTTRSGVKSRDACLPLPYIHLDSGVDSKIPFLIRWKL